MTIDPQSFHDSLRADAPDPGLPPPLAALWFEARGDWDRAHAAVADGATPAACRVHAYLHRREGDPGNAAYWYRRAGVPVVRGDLQAEWQALVESLLRPA